MIEKAKRDVQAMAVLLFSRSGILLVFALVGLILGLGGTPEGWWLFWVGLFTAFDVQLYAPSAQANAESAYRLGQGLLLIVLTLFVYNQAGMRITEACLIFWILLGSDYLYIWAKKEALRAFYYFDLSPVVLLFKYVFRKEAAPIWACNLSVLLGTAISVYLLFFH